MVLLLDEMVDFKLADGSVEDTEWRKHEEEVIVDVRSCLRDEHATGKTFG